MTGPKDVIREQLEASGHLVGMFTKDLTDGEYFKPAIAGGNHTAWAVGHIAVSEDSMLGHITGDAPRLPEAMRQLFAGGSECHPEASTYPSRSEIDEMLRTVRAHTFEQLAAFDEGRWDDPSPEALPQEFFPTVGSMWNMIASHSFWHIGQITCNRQALKKGRVFVG